jgi:hypothetical protein
MATFDPNMMTACSNMSNLLELGGNGVQIGNSVRDTAENGNWSSPFITAGQHLTTLAELAGKTLLKTSAALAAADFLLNWNSFRVEVNAGEVKDRTMLNLATSMAGGSIGDALYICSLQVEFIMIWGWHAKKIKS